MNLLVTAGPTQEPIDPVRFISNRSSGKMGFAVARASLARGHAVRLVSGPVHLEVPAGAQVIRVETAEEMAKAVEQNLEWCDALVMAAAVADWRPRVPAARKMKKRDAVMTLELEATRDILEAVRGRRGGRVFVGFAAETHDVLSEARRKLAAKGLDMIVANDVTRPGAGFDVDTNEVAFVTADGTVSRLPLMSKLEVGSRIVAWIEHAREEKGGA